MATKCGANLPFFSSLRKLRAPFESELLFIDRNLAMLKEGGVLLIVIPDGIVSAAGPASILRNYLREQSEIRAVVDLPAVTFAQAGTRTRTSVLYLRKRSPVTHHRNSVFFGIVRDLGFQVNSRKGVQIKSASGINELPALLDDYRASRDLEFKSASAIRVDSTDLEEQFTPSHYIAKADARETNNSHDDIHVVRLDELAEFSGKRKMRRHRTGDAFISVLHVVSEGVLDIRAARAYAPVTPGLPVEPGEVLLSKINPRIPRVIVAPQLGQTMLCSSEFEVMRPKREWDAYTIAFLLLSPEVQKQVQALTSGTSSSHNRIKTKDLAGIQIAIPRKGTKSATLLRKQVAEYQSALEKIADGCLQISLLREQESA